MGAPVIARTTHRSVGVGFLWLSTVRRVCLLSARYAGPLCGIATDLSVPLRGPGPIRVRRYAARDRFECAATRLGAA